MFYVNASNANSNKNQLVAEYNPILNEYRQKQNLFLQVEKDDIYQAKVLFNVEIQSIDHHSLTLVPRRLGRTFL